MRKKPNFYLNPISDFISNSVLFPFFIFPFPVLDLRSPLPPRGLKNNVELSKLCWQLLHLSGSARVVYLNLPSWRNCFCTRESLGGESTILSSHSPHGFMVTAPTNLARTISPATQVGTSTRPISSYHGVCESCLSRRSSCVSLKWTWGVQKQTMRIIFLVRTYNESFWIRHN